MKTVTVEARAMKYKRLTKKGDWHEDIDLKDECGYNPFSRIYQRLAELEDKIENGTLIELPISYGTELHFLYSREHYGKPQPPKVHSTKEWIYNIRSDGKRWFSSNDIPCGYYGEYLHEIGETVFTTKAEAEQKLKELKGDL